MQSDSEHKNKLFVVKPQNVLDRAPDLNSTECLCVFHLLKTRMKAKKPTTKQAAIEYLCTTGWVTLQTQWSQLFADGTAPLEHQHFKEFKQAFWE